MKHIIRVVLAMAIVVAFAGAPPVAQTVDPSCLTQSTPTTYTGQALQDATPTRDGVTWNAGAARLELNLVGGNFQSQSFAISEKLQLACSADFDLDGWVDFVGAGPDAQPFIYLYFNDTRLEPEPDWATTPTAIRTPRFTRMDTDIHTGKDASGGWVSRGGGVIGCQDLNADGRPDIVIARCGTGNDCIPIRADVYLNQGVTVINADPDGNPATDDATRRVNFATRYQFVTSLSTVSQVGWSANAVDFLDYNRDGRMDMVWALNNPPRVDILLNDGAAQPKFDTKITVVSGIATGARMSTTVEAGDFTGDGVTDLVVGGVALPGLRLYPGLEGGGFTQTCQTYDGTPASCQTYDLTYQTVPSFLGGATAILGADFTLDGRLDIAVGTDDSNYGTNQGGIVKVWANNRTTTPFDNVTPSVLTDRDPATLAIELTQDLDLGFVFDYDHDPQNTPDFAMADGNNSGAYYVFANRVIGEYVQCGYVTSNQVDIGAAGDLEMTVSTVRLDPEVSTSGANGGTVTWEASIDGGNTFVAAVPCEDDATEFCATFSTSVGKDIRWRANLCSDDTRTKTPALIGVELEYTYVTAQNHFRAGPIASGNVIYVGAFRRPGDEGKLFAIADDTGTTMWEAGEKLDAQATRNVFTVGADNVRHVFAGSQVANEAFRQVLLATDEATAQTIVDWTLSARFGLDDPSVFGAIENSTGALLTAPSAPYWYIDKATTSEEREAIDEYLTENATRQNLLFVGSKDGAMHAFYTNPDDPTDPLNGTEAWAFIPFDVAQRLNTDRIAGVIEAYPDGSPTLISAKVADEWRTILVSGEGNGGRHVFALDVTSTVAADGTVTGPTPLWSFSDPNMGRTYSKPTVIRVKVAGEEKWLAVFASGPGFGVDVGDTVYAVDLTTGQLVWRFDIDDTDAYVATDITAAETDDEAGTAEDGYIDRLFFADNKGRVWKLDPAAYSSTSIAPVASLQNVGLTHLALFSTRVSAGALGEDRAIAGTMAAAEDATGRLVLFFGTGGTDDTPNDVQNEFYAVYADTGEVRSKLGAAEGIAVGTKFYGGVVYNDGQLIFSSGSDLSGLGLCTTSAGEIVAIDANTFATQFTIPTSSKIVAPLFARNGQIYTVTLRGEVVTTPYTGEPGGASGPSGGGGASLPGGGTSIGAGQATSPFDIQGWRQVY